MTVPYDSISEQEREAWKRKSIKFRDLGAGREKKTRFVLNWKEPEIFEFQASRDVYLFDYISPRGK